VALRKIASEERGLTPLALQRLLEWLDDGADSNGEAYLEMRRRLVSYFDRRNRQSPDDLADETLNRVGATLEKTGRIAVTPPARYCYVVAKYVLLEDIRRDHRDVPFAEVALKDQASPAAPDAADLLREQRLDCLDRCLAGLKPEQRDLVLEYYRSDERRPIERRREMASRLGISANALAIRACRIRDTLQGCVAACCTRPTKAFMTFCPTGRTIQSG
jgi:DNA-directed RNA polymerase specialized sigma24 family protein